jgi:DNA-binding NarL/FixJ family response regulator
MSWPMKNILTKRVQDTVKILLVGNNPIELSSVIEKLREVRKQKIVTETAFDMKSIVERLANFNPTFILIDDNIGRAELMNTAKKLSLGRKTRNIPITVLKNSNYHEATASSNILDYLLKQNLSAEGLYNTIRNAFRFRRTQKLLLEAYQRRKGLFQRLTEKRMLDLIS